MYYPTGATTYTLNSSIGSTDTTITLSSFTEPVSGTPYTMALINSDIVYATIGPKTTSSEFISFTGITQNSDGTATLTGVTRGLSRSYPFASSATFKLPHAGQSQFILSNSPEQINEYAVLRNDNVFTGSNSVPTPVTGNNPTTKDYVDNLVNGGPVSMDQLIVVGTAGETVAAGNLVYQKVADGFWWKTDADTAATVDVVQLGIAQGAGTASNNISGGVLLRGIDTNQSGGTKGIYGYVSNTAGAISTTTGTTERVVGQYNSATTFYFDPNFFYIPTANQKAAMQGGGSLGTPSATNKFLTQTGLPLTDVQTFTAIGGNKTFTVTIATPAVFTLNNHGFTAGSPVYFTTDGALPTGLTASTVYYVISTGLATNTFEVSATLNGSAVNTSGSQSGTHTAHNAWVKPTGAKAVQITLVGAGGGGAGGVNGSIGGAGGGGGAANLGTFIASILGTNEEIIVGTGGAGGAVNTIGADGTISSFGTWINAGGGGGGAGVNDGGGGGGVISSGSGSTGGIPTIAGAAIGGQGPTASSAVRSGEWGGGSGGSANSSTAGSSSIYGGGGGGAGGVTTTAFAGGTSGSYSIGGGGAAGGAGLPGGAGSANTVIKKGYGGQGGGGGGGAAAGNAGAGGAGGFPGGGGGGGGGTGTTTAGVGGSGANGQVIVTTYF